MDPNETMQRRRERFSVLSRSSASAIESLWANLGIDVRFRRLKGPVSGLVAVQGRIGGGGDPFQFGEATITRAVIELETGETGFGQALGRDSAKVERCALIDALAQRPEIVDRIDAELIAPLRDMLDQEQQIEREKVAATKVDFFTLVRGED